MGSPRSALPSRPFRSHRLLAAARPVLLASVLSRLAGCSDLAPFRDVRATILDEEGRPLPGALFWAEARDESGVFGALIAVAGQAGEVPDSAREPLKIAWRPGARLTLAAFAPGRVPALVGGGKERVRSDGAVLVLAPCRPGVDLPPLGDLALPLAGASGIPDEVRNHPARSALEAAFRDALAARIAAGAELSPEERRKARRLGLSE